MLYLTFLSLFFVALNPSQAAEESRQLLGTNRIGEERSFSYDSGQLIDSSSDGTTISASPCAAHPVAVEFITRYSSINTGIEGDERLRFIPLLLCSDGAIYSLPDKFKPWQRNGEIPESSASFRGSLAADPSRTNTIFAISGHSVWVSTDAAHSWSLLASFTSELLRLSVGLDQQLYAFTVTGVRFGQLEASEHGMTWAVKSLELSLQEARTAYLLDAGVIAAEDSELHVYSLTERAHSIEASLSRSPKGFLIDREVSLRNAFTRGCSYTFRRFIPSTGEFRLDNYWDFNFRAISIHLRVSGSSKNDPRCTWVSPFSSSVYHLTNWDGQKIHMGTSPSNIYVRVTENPNSWARIRAIGLHIEDSSKYKTGISLKAGDRDEWAIIAQQSRNGGTACEALRNSPTLQDALRARRAFLSVELFGSNPGCPQENFSAIPCIGSSSVTSNSVSGQGSAASSLFFLGGQFSPLFRSGMGECVLPVIE